MEEQNIQEFEWVSEEVEKLYNMVNKIFSAVMIKRFPYIRRIEVNKRDFNSVLGKEVDRFTYDEVDVEICADWFSKEYNNDEQIEKEEKKGGIGSVMGDLWKDVLLLTGSILLENKRIFLKLILNKTSFCKGYIKYTIDE